MNRKQIFLFVTDIALNTRLIKKIFLKMSNCRGNMSCKFADSNFKLLEKWCKNEDFYNYFCLHAVLDITILFEDSTIISTE